VSNEVTIRHDIRCGDLGRIVSLHGEAYASLPGYGLRFEAFVGRTIADYILDDNRAGRIWLAERSNTLVGCAAIVLRANNLAQLRWVVVSPTARGCGLGTELLDLALSYSTKQKCDAIVLTTTDGLPESEALYEKLGFQVSSNTTEDLWDGERSLIRMRLDLD